LRCRSWPAYLSDNISIRESGAARQRRLRMPLAPAPQNDA
jgi:hypothetical protein